MTTIREGARKIEQEISHSRVPPLDNQAPLQEQVSQGGKVPVNPLLMSDGDIWATFKNMTQVMVTQTHVVTTQSHSMKAKTN